MIAIYIYINIIFYIFMIICNFYIIYRVIVCVLVGRMKDIFLI